MNVFYARHVIPDDIHYHIKKGLLVALSNEALRKHFHFERLTLGPMKIHFLLQEGHSEANQHFVPWGFIFAKDEMRTELSLLCGLLNFFWNNNMLSSIFLSKHWSLSSHPGTLGCTVWKHSSRWFSLTAPPPMQSLVENYRSNKHSKQWT